MLQIKFKRIIRKVGGSYMVAIPQEILEAFNLKEEDEVEIIPKSDFIKIKKKH